MKIFIRDFSKDYSDGRVDNKSGGAAFETSLSITPEQVIAGLGTAIKNFMKSERNKSNASFSFSFSG